MIYDTIFFKRLLVPKQSRTQMLLEPVIPFLLQMYNTILKPFLIYRLNKSYFSFTREMYEQYP